MAVYLSNLSEAYGPLVTNHWEKKENPQHYNDLPLPWASPNPHRHILGLVGGNDVSPIKGNLVDLESDLKGINIPHTFAPWKQYQPPQQHNEIVRDNVKGSVQIDIQKAHLPSYQMIAYPAVIAPLPMVSEVCMKPEKY